jgi:hypothetical protein
MDPVELIDWFIEQTGFTHPILRDFTGNVSNTYTLTGGISPFPRDFIIDQEGIIVYGRPEYNPLEMQLTIDLLLAQSTPGARAPIPENTTLAVFPNPFNSQASIRFSPAISGRYRLELYDLLGRRAEWGWEGYVSSPLALSLNADGDLSLSSGIYWLRAVNLQAQRTEKAVKLILLK